MDVNAAISIKLPHGGSIAGWLDRVGPDTASAEAALVVLALLAGWVAVGFACALVGRLPGALGQVADRCARVVLPKALYRLAAGAAGVGLLLAPATNAAASVRSPVSAGAGVPVPADAAPAPAWPSDAPLPAPGWPTGGQNRPRPAPHRTIPVPARHALHDSVVVRPGDSLWSIAAEHLPTAAGPAAVARSWPRWYGANRAVVGADPDLLHPGQVLTAPDPSPASPSAPSSKDLP